jgi:hypothetical protein
MACVRLLAIGPLALVCGCTPMAWEHQSFGTPPTVAETEECRRSAYVEAQHRAFFHSFVRPRFYRDRRGRLIHDPWPPFGRYDPFFLEQDLFRFCLQAKGYRLVPTRSADAMDG